MAGGYVDGNQINNYYISMFQNPEREFVVTHNANIKPVSYFTGRETELQELRQRIEHGRKSILVGGGGIGKTHICRKLFEEYLNKHVIDENGSFQHIGYIEYSGDMSNSLQSSLKFKQQDIPEHNMEAAWHELEYLASGGKLLLFVDNVDKPISADPGLQRLKSIPGPIILTSRQTSFSDEFEPYQIGFLGMEQCKEIYEKIWFEGSGRKVKPNEVQDLEYVIDSMAGRHTVTIELLAHLARTKLWTVKRLQNELEQKGFQLQFHKDEELVNIQESYKVLYDKKTVFLSYNWHDVEIANRIDANLSKLSNIEVKKDMRDIGPWKSTRKFMKSIRQQDYAILIISDSYLCSKNCMFEVTEIMKEPEYESRIFLVIVEKKIYDPIIRVKYIKYWQDECDKLEAAIRELDPINAVDPLVDLKCYKSIAFSVGEFLSLVADRNNPDIQEIEKEIEKAIFKNE